MISAWWLILLLPVGLLGLLCGLGLAMMTIDRLMDRKDREP